MAAASALGGGCLAWRCLDRAVGGSFRWRRSLLHVQVFGGVYQRFDVRARARATLDLVESGGRRRSGRRFRGSQFGEFLGKLVFVFDGRRIGRFAETAISG